MSVLDLSNNYLTGVIPGWIGNLYGLSMLLISNNYLEGQIPVSLIAISLCCWTSLQTDYLVTYLAASALIQECCSCRIIIFQGLSQTQYWEMPLYLI
ncbi:unnamed protein product [Brassica napus]|uniref:(rape) hypothetical protein n=1 Tax=Brassica napus TaxID=3708 RepID=A0A816KIH8_BRANA|nr:unnamed protein product [Brassica napus]